MKKIIKNLQETYQIGDWFDLLSLLFKTLFLAHFIACLWYALGCYSKNNSDTNRSWLDINRIIELPWQNRYLYSLYWVFMTLCTVGYGDVTPQNSQEIAFCCAVMLMGTFAFGYCLNTVGALLNRMEERYKEMNKNMKIVDNYMHRKNINVNLRKKVKKYLEFLWESQNKTVEKEEEFIDKLPISIKHEILLESNMKFLKEFPIITNNFSPEIIELIALNIKPIQFSPADIIYNEKSTSDIGLFLILNGEINLTIKGPQKNEIHLKKLKKGDLLAEKPFFLNIGYEESAQSIGFSTVYKIPLEIMLDFLKVHQKDHEKFCEIRDKGLFSSEVSIFQKCYSCKEAIHSVQECPYLIYLPNRSFLLERLNFSRLQKRLFNERNKTKKNSLFLKKTIVESVLQLRFDKNLMIHYYDSLYFKTNNSTNELDNDFVQSSKEIS